MSAEREPCCLARVSSEPVRGSASAPSLVLVQLMLVDGFALHGGDGRGGLVEQGRSSVFSLLLAAGGVEGRARGWGGGLSATVSPGQQ